METFTNDPSLPENPKTNGYTSETEPSNECIPPCGRSLSELSKDNHHEALQSSCMEIEQSASFKKPYVTPSGVELTIDSAIRTLNQ